MRNDAETRKTPWSLLARLKDFRDSKSWHDFDQRYRPLVVSIAREAGLGADEAKDVAQETMASISRNIGAFVTKPEHGSFRAWLLNLVRWRIADQFRKRIPLAADAERSSTGEGRTPRLESVPDESPPNLEAMCDAKWAEWLMNAAMEELRLEMNADHYQVFHLLTIQEKSIEEVLKLTGKSRAQVYLIKHRVSNALKRIVRRVRRELE